MKKITTILLILLISISCFGQIKDVDYSINPYATQNNTESGYTVKKISSNAWKWLAVTTVSITLDMAGDACMDEGYKQIGHVLEAASVGSLLGGMFWLDPERKQWPWYLLSYISARIAYADPMYNGVRGLPWNYHGTTDPWDTVWDYMYDAFNPPPGAELFGRSIFLTISITVTLQQIK